MCNYCSGKRQLEKVCNQRKSDNIHNFGRNRGLAKRNQLVDHDHMDEEEKHYMVLNVEGSDNDAKP